MFWAKNDPAISSGEVGVKTNSADKVTITLKHTDLKCSEHTIPVKIRIDGGAEFAQGQIIPVLNSTQDTEKGARAIVKELGLTFNSQEAAAGTYTATLTMTVTGA